MAGMPVHFYLLLGVTTVCAVVCTLLVQDAKKGDISWGNAGCTIALCVLFYAWFLSLILTDIT